MSTHPVTKLARQLFGAEAEAILFQQRVYDLIAEGKSVVLQAPTGAGKTFAALAPFVLGEWGAGDGPPARKLIYSFPLRVLAGSLKTQYEDLLPERLADAPLRFTTQYSGATEDRFLDGGDGYWIPDENNVVPGTRHAVFTTIDQTLSGFAGVPLSVPYRQANVLYGSILSGALIFDEFHLLEPKKSFQTALHLLPKSPWPVLIMTATMSKTLRSELCEILDAEEVVVGKKDLPHIKSQSNTVKHVCVKSEALNGKALADQLGERTLVICNRVARAQDVFDDLDDELRERDDDRKRMLLHSRFLPEDRSEKEGKIEEWFGEESEGRAVLVATQVVEAGLDISADVLHTEISPIDSFLQRIGRSARFAGENEAQIHVYPLLSMEGGDFLPYDEEATRQTLEHLHGQPKLRFEDLQGLIDEILTGYHQQIIQAYRNGKATRAAFIQQTREAGDYAANKALVRHIDNVDVILADPRSMEEGEVSPYAYPAVSLPEGTFRGFLSEEDSQAFVVEEYTDEAGQQPGDGYFAVQLVEEGKKWPSRRFVIQPAHAAYDKRLGLRLGTSGSRMFVPDEEAAERMRYEYEKEEYKEHIRRLYEQVEVRQASLDALRRLSSSDQHPQIKVNDPERVVDFIIWAHDLAKLANGWQVACGDPNPPLAHGGRIKGKRPSPHAAESAFAAGRMLGASGEPRDVQVCAYAAICRHHSPSNSIQPSAYRVSKERQRYLRRITPSLPTDLGNELVESWQHLQWSANGSEELQPLQVEREVQPIYALLVYILRRSDQLATSEVSEEYTIDNSPSVTGVSNFL